MVTSTSGEQEERWNALAARTSARQSQQELEESLGSLGYISFDSSPAKPKG